MSYLGALGAVIVLAFMFAALGTLLDWLWPLDDEE